MYFYRAKLFIMTTTYQKLTLIILLLKITTNSFCQIPNYVPSNGLVGYWGFNGNANDASGNNNHGVASNAYLTTDRFGQTNSAYQFNGSNARIDVSNAFFNVGWNSYTISAWTYSTNYNNPNNYNDSQIIINTNLHNGIAITGYGNNNPFNSIWDNRYVFLANSNPIFRAWDMVLSNGYSNTFRAIYTWKHIVLVKSNNTFRLYVDGVLDKTVVSSLSANSYFCRMVFGNISPEIPANSESFEGFLGKLDDFGIWNRALSQSEITALYNSTICTSLLSLSSPEDDYNAGAYQKSALGNNGKIIATNKITGSANLIYNAKSSIEFNAGFQVNSGAIFKTEIAAQSTNCE